MSQKSEQTDAFLTVVRKYLPENHHSIMFHFDSGSGLDLENTEQVLKHLNAWKMVLDEVNRDLDHLNLLNLDIIVAKCTKACLYFLNLTDVSKM